MQPSVQHHIPQQCSQCRRAFHATMPPCTDAMMPCCVGCSARLHRTHTRACILRVYACACVCTCGCMCATGHLPTVPFLHADERTALLHNDHAAIDCVAAVRSKRHKPKAKAAAAVAGQERYPRLIDVKDQAIPLIYPQSH